MGMYVFADVMEASKVERSWKIHAVVSFCSVLWRAQTMDRRERKGKGGETNVSTMSDVGGIVDETLQ